MKRILVTGGSGLLGSELKKILPYLFYPTSSEFNVINFSQMDTYLKTHMVDSILHAAAFTSPPKIDDRPLKALDVNIIGTANLVKLCANYQIKIVYISTDYIFKGDKGNYKENDPVFPVNKYAWSKLGGECAVRMYDNSLIIRTSFGPNDFPYEKAFADQWTSREQVKVIAKKISRLLKTDATGIIHIGGMRKTVFQYAKDTSPEKKIEKISRGDVNFIIPKDTSLNTEKYKKLIKLK